MVDTRASILAASNSAEPLGADGARFEPLS